MYNTDALTAGLWARCASEQHGDACLEFVRITSPETKIAAPGWAKWKFSPLSHHTWSSSFCFFPASNFPACLMVVGGDKHVCIGNRRTGDSSGERGNPPTHTRNPLFFHDDGGFTIRRRPRHLFKFLTASLDSAAPSQRPSIRNGTSMSLPLVIGDGWTLGSPVLGARSYTAYAPAWRPPLSGQCWGFSPVPSSFPLVTLPISLMDIP